MRGAVLGAHDVEVIAEGAALGALLTATGHHAEAEPLLRSGLATIAATLRTHSHEWGIVAHDLATLLAATGRPDEALPLLHEIAAMDCGTGDDVATQRPDGVGDRPMIVDCASCALAHRTGAVGDSEEP